MINRISGLLRENGIKPIQLTVEIPTKTIKRVIFFAGLYLFQISFVIFDICYV
jgi:hypothetical protein